MIDNVPAVGQGIADALTSSRGIASSAFRRAVDHPPATLADRPDFLLECDDYDIIVEHKLDSGLGDVQLERYLAWAARCSKPTYLALVASHVCEVAEDVVQSPLYLTPRAHGRRHFAWSDLYPAVARQPDRIAREFAELMADLGMRPLSSAGWSDLFTSREQAQNFYEQLAPVRDMFKSVGAKCRRDPSSLGMQVKFARPWLPLLYMHATMQVEAAPPGIDGPFFRIAAFLPRASSGAGVQQGIAWSSVESRTWSRSPRVVASWDNTLILEREYLTRIDQLLTDDPLTTRSRLQSCAIAVVDDLNQRYGT